MYKDDQPKTCSHVISIY